MISLADSDSVSIEGLIGVNLCNTLLDNKFSYETYVLAHHVHIGNHLAYSFFNWNSQLVREKSGKEEKPKFVWYIVTKTLMNSIKRLIWKVQNFYISILSSVPTMEMMS